LRHCEPLKAGVSTTHTTIPIRHCEPQSGVAIKQHAVFFFKALNCKLRQSDLKKIILYFLIISFYSFAKT
jgi:hypothetical protein